MLMLTGLLLGQPPSYFARWLKWPLGLAAICVGLVGVVWIIVYWNSRPWRR
jgi:hypothetical protein